MTRERTKYAMQEAHRFLQKAKAALATDDPNGDWISPSKESGAARRASLDLTRALADMRRPPS